MVVGCDSGQGTQGSQLDSSLPRAEAESTAVDGLDGTYASVAPLPFSGAEQLFGHEPTGRIEWIYQFQGQAVNVRFRILNGVGTCETKYTFSCQLNKEEDGLANEGDKSGDFLVAFEQGKVYDVLLEAPVTIRDDLITVSWNGVDLNSNAAKLLGANKDPETFRKIGEDLQVVGLEDVVLKKQ